MIATLINELRYLRGSTAKAFLVVELDSKNDVLVFLDLSLIYAMLEYWKRGNAKSREPVLEDIYLLRLSISFALSAS